MRRKLSNEEFEGHFRESLKHDDMPNIYAAEYDGYARTLSQADTQALQRHGYGQALQDNWARFQGFLLRPYGYVNGRNPYDKNALWGILNMYHSLKAERAKSKQVISENDLPDSADYIQEASVRVKAEDYITRRKTGERLSGTNLLNKIDLEEALSLPKSARHEELRNIIKRVTSYAIPIEGEVSNYINSVPSLPHNEAREQALSRAGDMPEGVKEKLALSVVKYNSLDRPRYGANLEAEMSALGGASAPAAASAAVPAIDKESIKKQIEARMQNIANTRVPKHHSRKADESDEDLLSRLLRR